MHNTLIHKSIRILFVSAILLASFGQIGRVQITSSLSFYGFEVLFGVVILLAFVGGYGSFLIGQIKKPGIARSITIFFSWVFLTLLASFLFQKPTLVPILYFIRSCLYVLILGLPWWMKQKKIQIQSVAAAFSMIFVFLTILFHVFISDTRFLFWYGWDDHLGRVLTPLLDPAFGALVLIGIFFLSYQRRMTDSTRAFQFITLVLLAGTFSRSGYIAWIVAHLVFIWTGKMRKELVWIPLFLMLIFLTPKPDGEGGKLARTSTILARTTTQQSLLQKTSLKTILIGEGWYNYKSNTDSLIPNHATSADNSFLHVFVSAGIVGLVLFILIITRAAVIAAPAEKAFILGAIIHSQFSNTLFYPWFFVMLLLFAMKKIMDDR